MQPYECLSANPATLTYIGKWITRIDQSGIYNHSKNKTQQNPVHMVMYSSYVGQTIHRNEPVRWVCSPNFCNGQERGNITHTSTSTLVIVAIYFSALFVF